MPFCLHILALIPLGTMKIIVVYYAWANLIVYSPLPSNGYFGILPVQRSWTSLSLAIIGTLLYHQLMRGFFIINCNFLLHPLSFLHAIICLLFLNLFQQTHRRTLDQAQKYSGSWQVQIRGKCCILKQECLAFLQRNIRLKFRTMPIDK